MGDKILKVPDYLIEKNKDLYQEIAVCIALAKLADREASKQTKGA